MTSWPYCGRLVTTILLLSLIKCHGFTSIQKPKLLNPSRTAFTITRIPRSASPRLVTKTQSRTIATRPLSQHIALGLGGFELEESIISFTESLFSYEGNVPFWQALGLNAVLFGTFSSKLRTMLTPEGFANAMALGTLLWTTLGWRGWSVCVMYLLLGQLVTKVKFAEKEKRGIAEKRGGRRGPENVW